MKRTMTAAHSTPNRARTLTWLGVVVVPVWVHLLKGGIWMTTRRKRSIRTSLAPGLPSNNSVDGGVKETETEMMMTMTGRTSLICQGRQGVDALKVPRAVKRTTEEVIRVKEMGMDMGGEITTMKRRLRFHPLFHRRNNVSAADTALGTEIGIGTGKQSHRHHLVTSSMKSTLDFLRLTN